MTRKQTEKLGRIIAKLEALQAELDRAEVDTINHAKTGLIKLWSKNVK